MGTRSTIAIQNEDGSVTGIYCHWDGYLNGNTTIPTSLWKNLVDNTHALCYNLHIGQQDIEEHTMSMMELLRETYPRTKATKHSAFCERIPIAIFDLVEEKLRPEMRQRGYRAMYRGPRVSNDTRTVATMTRRCDATHVLLYRK